MSIIGARWWLSDRPKRPALAMELGYSQMEIKLSSWGAV